MTPARLRWGLILISIGVLIILCNTGHLDWDYWIDLIEWWPILLIAIGIEKIFQHSKLSFIAYLSPLILIGTMTIIAIDHEGDGYYRTSIFDSYRWNWETDEAVDRMVVEITHERYDLTIGATNSYLASARFEKLGQRPHIYDTIENGLAKLEIVSRKRPSNRIIIGGHDFGNDWRIKLTDQKPMELTCRGDRSDINLNLESFKIEKLSVNDDDGYITLRIGDESPSVAVDIEGYDAVCKFKYPKEAGIKVEGLEYRSILEELDFKLIDKYYYSPNYDSSTVKIDLKIGSSLKKFSFNDY